MTLLVDGPAVGSTGYGSVDIDLLRPGEWQDLRFVRLAALTDSPDAFVANLAKETMRRPEEWIDEIRRSTWAVARHLGNVVGIASLTHEHFIESVWVNCQYRQRGLGQRMLQELEMKARVAGAECLQLWVLEDNLAAYDAYIKLSFSEVPEREQPSEKLRSDGTPVQERLMVKPLL